MSTKELESSWMLMSSERVIHCWSLIATMLRVLILSMSDGTYSLNSCTNDRFLEIFSLQFYLHSTCLTEGGWEEILFRAGVSIMSLRLCLLYYAECFIISKVWARGDRYLLFYQYTSFERCRCRLFGSWFLNSFTEP